MTLLDPNRGGITSALAENANKSIKLISNLFFMYQYSKSK